MVVDNETLKELDEVVVYSFWEPFDETHTVIRFATSWATPEENIEALKKLIEKYGNR